MTARSRPFRAFVEHYSESDKKLFAYDVRQLEPALQGTLLNTTSAILANATRC